MIWDLVLGIWNFSCAPATSWQSSWLPQLLQQSGNPRVQPGQPGHFIAGQKVRRLEIPTAVDRAHGDVHPSGNPHIQLHPRNILRVAKALAQRMAELDPAQADAYASGLQAFSERWAAAIARWEAAAAPLQGTAVVPHHKDMVYLLAWLDMHEVGNLEPKPGLEPSSAHLAELLTRLQHEPAKLVLRTPYQSFAAAMVLLVAALSALTVKQIALWKDCNVLWSYVIDEGKVASSIAHNNRGVCRESAGLSDAAAEDYGNALLLNPRDDQALYNLGNIYYKSGMTDQAIALYTSSISINAKRANAYYNRGVSYTIKNQHREALADMNKAIELKQDFDMAYFSRGRLFSRIGQRTAAVADYEKACSLGYQAACQELAVRGHL